MRFFIALEIPSENLPQFQAIQVGLHTLIPQVKLTDSEKIHLTLAFIGEQPDTFKDSLTKIIQDATLGVHSFKVTPAYIDGFPNIHSPHTIWVGVKGDIDKLLLIREHIKDGLANLSLPINERRFTPHIVIAKANNHLRINRTIERKLTEIMAINFHPIQIQSIKLFESIPEHGFHRHNTLAKIKLG